VQRRFIAVVADPKSYGARRSLGTLRMCRLGERIELSLVGQVHGLEVATRPIGRRRRHP
jgi:hypothetical protein